MNNPIIEFLYRLIKYIMRKACEQKALKLSGIRVKCLGDIMFNCSNVHFGQDVTLYPNVTLWGENISIGNNTCIGDNTIIHSSRSVKIGDDVSIAAGCYIIDSNHGTKPGELIRLQPSDIATDGITIGNDVWIGTQTIILKGSVIEDGAIIGANSLVNSHIPVNAIAFGNPAKVHTFRS